MLKQMTLEEKALWIGQEVAHDACPTKSLYGAKSPPAILFLFLLALSPPRRPSPVHYEVKLLLPVYI